MLKKIIDKIFSKSDNINSSPKEYTSNPIPNNPNQAVIITALEVEFNAIIAHISDLKEERHEKGTIYQVGKFKNWQVAVAQIGMGNACAAMETERAIELFKPSHVFFVGVAGGIKDVKLGDVVATTKVYGYESGKITDDGFKNRPEVEKSTHTMTQLGKAIAREQKWQQRIIKNKGTPNAIVAPIVVGGKVIASIKSEVYQI